MSQERTIAKILDFYGGRGYCRDRGKTVEVIIPATAIISVNGQGRMKVKKAQYKCQLHDQIIAHKIPAKEPNGAQQQSIDRIKAYYSQGGAVVDMAVNLGEPVVISLITKTEVPNQLLGVTRAFYRSAIFHIGPKGGITVIKATSMRGRDESADVLPLIKYGDQWKLTRPRGHRG